MMTGGDRQKGRFHYKPFFEYEPTAKIHLVGNHKPRIGGRDDGIWRRFRLVDWAVKIPDERKDLRLSHKLQPEFPGILNWMIEGALALGERGTQPPASVLVATSKFREDCDAFGDFLREKTIDDLGPAGEIPKSNLFELYKEYCTEQDIPARSKQSKRRIGFLMIERAYEEGKNAKGIRVWRGIRERTEEDDLADSQDLDATAKNPPNSSRERGKDDLGEKNAVASKDDGEPFDRENWEPF
jgi:putative DNA primase/helicase